MAHATFSCSHPQRVAVVLNSDNSGWHMDNTRLIDGIAGPVEHTALNFDAVIRPVLTRNHKRELAWLLVSSPQHLIAQSLLLFLYLLQVEAIHRMISQDILV